MRDAGDACLAHGGERRGERRVVWSRVIRPRNAGESESASLRGAARVGGRALARPKLWASAASSVAQRLLVGWGARRGLSFPPGSTLRGTAGQPPPAPFLPRVGPGRRVSSSGNRRCGAGRPAFPPPPA